MKTITSLENSFTVQCSLDNALNKCNRNEAYFGKRSERRVEGNFRRHSLIPKNIPSRFFGSREPKFCESKLFQCGFVFGCQLVGQSILNSCQTKVYLEVLGKTAAPLRHVVHARQPANHSLHGAILRMVIPCCGICRQPILSCPNQLEEKPWLGPNEVAKALSTQIRLGRGHRFKGWLWRTKEVDSHSGLGIVIDEIREKCQQYLTVFEIGALEWKLPSDRRRYVWIDSENEIQFVFVFNCNLLKETIFSQLRYCITIE